MEILPINSNPIYLPQPRETNLNEALILLMQLSSQLPRSHLSFARVNAYSLSPPPNVTLDDLYKFFDCLPECNTLRLCSCSNLLEEDFIDLIESGNLDSLESLTITNCMITDRVLEALANSPLRYSLKTLSLTNLTEVTESGFLRLFDDQSAWQQLQNLSLCLNSWVTDFALNRLTYQGIAANIRKLSLSNNHAFSEESLFAFLTQCRDLHTLCLENNDLEDSIIYHLTDLFSHLTNLRLGANQQISSEALCHLVRHFSQSLKTLDLTACPGADDALADALLNCCTEHLRTLYIEETSMTDQAISNLIDARIEVIS